MKLLLYIVTLSLLAFCLSPTVFAQSISDPNWSMVGHDYTRSSHSPTEVTGKLNPEWYRSFEAYIPRKVQIIAATVNNLDTLFISTAAGLYALSTDGSTVRWVYPTELPLGNSPTLTNNILYVGGYDRRIHAINASDGKLKSGWTFYEAGAGFETNPMVVNNTVYAGNRDGYFYALDANTGTLKWRFQTNGPILFSAAYKDNTLYFASNDSYAYAVNATTGQQVWKSVKFPGMGFHTWWPVIYTEPLSQVVLLLSKASDHTSGQSRKPTISCPLRPPVMLAPPRPNRMFGVAVLRRWITVKPSTFLRRHRTDGLFLF